MLKIEIYTQMSICKAKRTLTKVNNAIETDLNHLVQIKSTRRPKKIKIKVKIKIKATTRSLISTCAL